MGGMDVNRVTLLREILAGTGWVDRTREFARTLRSSARTPGTLLLVGTPDEEPWHLAAHLDDEARLSGVAELSPTLLRWAPPPLAPGHLSVGLDRLEGAARGETVFVVAQNPAPDSLLERVDDARRSGATVLALDGGDQELARLAHDALTVPAEGLMPPSQVAGLSAALASSAAVDRMTVPELTTPAVSFDTVQHLVSMAAGEVATGPARWRGGRLRNRITRLLDPAGGPAPLGW